MPVGCYKISNPEAIHFITFAVVDPIAIGRIDVFARKVYCDIVPDSLRYCQRERGLIIHGWCLMSNHIHLVVSAKNEDTSDILHDFKKFTSKQIIKANSENTSERRKEWMLQIFKEQGKKTSEIAFTSFGDRITNPKNYFPLDLPGKR